MQGELLNTPIGDLTHVEFVFFAAINFVHGAELLQLLAGRAEFADDAAIEFHLVDFAVIEIGGAVGIGAVEILVRARCNTDGPRRADIGVLSFGIAIVIEHLDALVAAITYVNVPLRINSDGMRSIKLANRSAPSAPGLNEDAVFVKFSDAGVSVAIGDENISGSIPGHIGGAIEVISRDAGAVAASAATFAATTFSTRGRRGDIDGLRFPAHSHEHVTIGIELDDHVRAFIHDPDVILRIHANGVGENETVKTLTDLTDILAALVEFKKTRGRPHEDAIGS